MENILNYEFLKQFAVACVAGSFIGLAVWSVGQAFYHSVRGIIALIRKHKHKEDIHE